MLQWKSWTTFLILASLVTACAEAQEPERIVFVSDRDGSDALYVLDLGNSDVRRLTADSTGFATLAPDLQRIAYQSAADYRIRVMGLEESVPSQLPQPDSSLRSRPAWSPDGERIAFVGYRPGDPQWGIHVMKADGSGAVRLSSQDSTETNPAWSPDGERIVFQSYRHGNYELYVTNAQGTEETRLTHDPGNDGMPSWSPDGSRIAFESTRDGDFEIYLMDPDGENLVQLTHNEALDGGPVWSPDGKKILFHSDRDGNYEVYVMNADGTEQTRVTDHPAKDYRPVW